MRIRDGDDPENTLLARTLFEEYGSSLGIDLEFQDFARELESLPGRYARPTGRLWIMLDDEEPVGCVALQPYGDNECEMKRLYIRPKARGRGLSRLLVERLIAEARSIGYRRMLLDTLPSMAEARRLYASLGFHQIEPYRFNPVPGTSYMAIDL